MARVELQDVKSKEQFVRMIEGVVKGMLAFWEITTEQFQKNLSFSYFALFNFYVFLLSALDNTLL